jgi:hypothetical protein
MSDRTPQAARQLPSWLIFDVGQKMKAPYPYPILEKDGFQLAVVEHGDTSTPLPTPIPSDEERFAAKPGDLVKLIFEYRDADERENGAVVGSERMWVKITELSDSCLVGRIDSSPQHTKLLKSDDIVAFHPKHIISFWRQ